MTASFAVVFAVCFYGFPLVLRFSTRIASGLGFVLKNNFEKMMQENLQERKLYLSLQSQNGTGA